MSDYLIGGSPAIRRIKASLTKLAADTAPLVITGEPGVGKSLLSSRIHVHSPMSNNPIEFINFRTFTERDQRIRLLGGCPPELPSSRQSILETPTTVVLKHLDCATRFLQEQLTTAILEGKIYRLGGTEWYPISCRIIFVFRDQLNTLSRSGRLSAKLIHILKKYPAVHLPPLDKRKEDIPELAQHFFTQYQIQRYRAMDRKFIDGMMKNHWETNILDLKSFIKALDVPPWEVIIKQRDRLELTKMNMMIEERKDFALKDSMTIIEESLTEKALQRHGNSQIEAAQSLGVSDRSIRRTIK